MPLTLITGRANTGKTAVVRDVIRSACADGRNPALLLPTLPDVRRARAWLAAERPMGVRVDQFERFAAALWTSHGDGRHQITDAPRAVMMRRAIEVCPAASVLHTGSPGFTSFAIRVAVRLAEEPGWVLEQAEGFTRQDDAILELIRTYVRILDENTMIEPAAAVRLLSEAPPMLEGPVVAHDFTDLGAAQEALLLAWAEAGEHVCVTLPWEHGFAATEALTPLAERLAAQAATVIHRSPEPWTGDQPELVRLEAGLFSRPAPYPSEGAVSFASAIGEEAEWALVARHVRRLVERAPDPDRVAIVLRSAERHVDGLRMALSGEGIPADFDMQTAFPTTPLGAAFLQLMAYVMTGDRSALVAFLRSEFSGASPVALDMLEARWRRSREADPGRLTAGARDLGDGVARILAAAASLVRASNKPLFEAVRLVGGMMIGAAHDHATLQVAGEADLDLAAYRALVRVADDLDAVGGGDVRDLVEALREVRVTPGVSERPGRVQVTEAHRVRARRFDAVVVVGMTADGFSAEGGTNPAADLVDRLLGIERATVQARERLLYYSVVTRARRELVLTRCVADADGEPLRPSVFWEETLDLYREPGADEPLRIPEGAVASEMLGLASLEEAAPALLPGRRALRREVTTGEGPRRRPSRTIRGLLSDSALLGDLASRDTFSVTELERYAQCPYRWFYERVVRPERLDAELGPAETGSLAHRVLSGVYLRLPERTGSARVTTGTLNAARALVDEVFAEERRRTPTPMTLAEEDALETVLRRVRDLVTADRDFLCGMEPCAVELGFGLRDGEPVDLGGYRVRGSIDRVDEGSEGIVITDYKSGHAARGTEIQTRRLLQLPLYAAAARAIVGRPVLGALYRSLSTGENRGFWVDGSVDPIGLVSTDRLEDGGVLDELIAYAVDVGREAADGIRAGRIAPDGPAEGACDYCPAAAFCGERRWQ